MFAIFDLNFKTYLFIVLLKFTLVNKLRELKDTKKICFIKKKILFDF